MRYINGTRLDDRIIRTDWDAGFKEGRQYGRGRSGGQEHLRLDFQTVLLNGNRRTGLHGMAFHVNPSAEWRVLVVHCTFVLVAKCGKSSNLRVYDLHTHI
ncbi:uncharacterized protein LOC104127082 [Egretta garzetta]|uniref:uncharacterized protein LOC104127082 n=1 Tax=Egretta garzetta TaxID=188379 RepID=UPI00163CD89D|nr:uncharacterized protein LOC104127082 [Egretta garzetta]